MISQLSRSWLGTVWVRGGSNFECSTQKKREKKERKEKACREMIKSNHFHYYVVQPTLWIHFNLHKIWWMVGWEA